MSIELQWYFDSTSAAPGTQAKESTQTDRKQKKAQTITTMGAFFARAAIVPTAAIVSAAAAATVAVASPMLSYHSYNSIRPSHLGSVVIDTLQSISAKVVICIGEADPVLARDACDETYRLKGVPNPVFGVLSSDTDFAAVAGIKWLQLSSLRLGLNSGAIIDFNAYTKELNVGDPKSGDTRVPR